MTHPTASFSGLNIFHDFLNYGIYHILEFRFILLQLSRMNRVLPCKLLFARINIFGNFRGDGFDDMFEFIDVLIQERHAEAEQRREE